ncbi:MAG: Txe/YoeB family addiction module toxin [Propionibacteriaceae bacterium]|nr:Txe/YoeB family addiction module toxin [Propionibacteriaceae bacterium]
MILSFTQDGWEDYTYWQKTDRKTLQRINRLIADTMREPAGGIGKPEPLKWDLMGAWSKRITDEHRMVYLPKAEELIVLSLRYHYDR